MEENNEPKPDTGNFRMTVNTEGDNIFTLSGKGYILIGRIESGTIHLGDTVKLNNGMKSFVEIIQIAGNEEDKMDSVNWATKGEGCVLTLGSLDKGDLDGLEYIVIEGVENPNNDFEMKVTDKEYVKGKGVVISGEVISGAISIGDPVIVAKRIDGSIMKSSRISAIEIDGNNVETANKGQSVKLTFKGLTARNNVDETIGTKIVTPQEETESEDENNEVQQDSGHFSMPVNDLLTISGRGYVFSGTIQSGTVHIGDEVTLSNGLKSFVNGIEIGRELFEWATKGENPGLLLGSISTKTPIDTTGLTVEGIDTERNHCEISVTEQSPVKGNGINVKGKILSGTINVGDPIIYAEPDNGIFQTATVDAIETDGGNVQSAKQGQIVTLNFQGLTMRSKFDKVIKR